ncbi:MAG TPA: DUF1214 domain-containing protein [Terrimicrobiaceae bacterium]
MPVKQFWALTMYDRATFAFIYSDSNKTTLSSYDLGKMKKNADGSVTLYVGPKAPDGLESNWLPTGNSCQCAQGGTPGAQGGRAGAGGTRIRSGGGGAPPKCNHSDRIDGMGRKGCNAKTSYFVNLFIPVKTLSQDDEGPTAETTFPRACSRFRNHRSDARPYGSPRIWKTKFEKKIEASRFNRLRAKPRIGKGGDRQRRH